MPSRSMNVPDLACFLPTLPRLRCDSLLQRSDFSSALKLTGSNIRRRKGRLPLRHVHFRAFDGDSGDISSLDDWGHTEETIPQTISSSDGEDSDAEFVLTPVNDIELPAISVSNNDALTLTAHRLAMLGRQHKRHRIKHGVLVNAGLIIFLIVVLVYVDWCAWRIVRLPLDPFHLTRPFLISVILASCAGYICVPLLYGLKVYQIIRKEGPVRHSLKKRTPTMGGLFFIPVGVLVAKFMAGFSSSEVSGAAAATLAFAAIGLSDDMFSLIKNQNSGLSPWLKILLEAAVGTWFSFWLDTANGLDGLAGGTAALAFIGMSIAVLPICSDLAIFGASMAGACVGFLLHNRYKASVFMGDTGSVALGGALAAMAACTGMFLPLFVASGIFVMEASSVIMQVMYFKTTNYFLGAGRRLFRMAPFHHHLESCGLKEPVIVAGAYVMSSALALFAGYLGLISA